MKNYINEVLTPRLVSNIEKFFKVLYEELKGEKILRIEAEKKSKTQDKAYLKYDEIEVFLNGRADLLIETSKARYIVDFKTGGYKKEQLEFYAIMFYGSDNSLPVPALAFRTKFFILFINITCHFVQWDYIFISIIFIKIIITFF